jgi:excisionase family DNA binding protein
MSAPSRPALRVNPAPHERRRAPTNSPREIDLSDGIAPSHHEVSGVSDSGSLADRLAYSVAEAALVTGLSRDLLYDEMRAGRLHYLKVGRRRIITRRHLAAFLAE